VLTSCRGVHARRSVGALVAYTTPQRRAIGAIVYLCALSHLYGPTAALQTSAPRKECMSASLAFPAEVRLDSGFVPSLIVGRFRRLKIDVLCISCEPSRSVTIPSFAVCGDLCLRRSRILSRLDNYQLKAEFEVLVCSPAAVKNLSSVFPSRREPRE
jgi:hypothetical protein